MIETGGGRSQGEKRVCAEVEGVGIRRGDGVAGERFKVRSGAGGGVGGCWFKNIQVEARERPLYLELLKIARQMVVEASGRPDTRLPFQASGIDSRRAARGSPEPVTNSCCLVVSDGGWGQRGP